MKAAICTLGLLFAGVLAAQTPTAPENRNRPNGMKQYFFAFLVKGEKWDQTPPKEELNELMQKHLGYIRSQAVAGKYALAGPFLDNDRIRGFLSGRMAVEVHPAMMADVSCVLAEYKKNNDK
jgi:hypothetical protein